MSQITLEFSNNSDLSLLVSLAKRLNAHVVSLKSDVVAKPSDNRFSMLKQAAKDPLFLADIAEITADFEHIDKEML
jgi:hypothetical protein